MSLTGFGPLSKANNVMYTFTRNTLEDTVNLLNEMIQLAKDNDKAEFADKLYDLLEPKNKLTPPSQLLGGGGGER